MSAEAVDSWFVQFRQSGDPAALARVFDRTAPEILRLATHLTRDPHVAEDLLQETFLAAIDKAESFDQERRVLPWLVGVLVQLVRRHRRAAARQVDPERVALPSVESPEAQAQAAELSEALAGALEGLAEPYRPVLVLHLRHGLGAHEIAEALARPQGTVRTQLMRGLELVRRALPVGLVTGAALAEVSPRTLAAARAAVLARVPGGAALPAATTLLGGLWMAKKLGMVAAVLCVLVAGAGVWMWNGSSAGTGDGSAAGASRAAVAGTPAPEASTSQAAQPVASRVAVEPPTSTTAPGAGARGSLRVHVLWTDRTPAAEVGVRWKPMSPDGEIRARWSATTAGGDLLLDALAPGGYSFAADRGGETRALVRGGEQTSVELLIPAGIALECRTVDKDGQSVPRAQVWLSAAAGSPWDGRVVGQTGSDGLLRLRDVQPGWLVSARAAAFPWRDPLRVEAAPETQSLRLELFGSGRALEGRVVDPAGAPVPDCQVVVGGAVSGATSEFSGLVPDPVWSGSGIPQSVRTDPGGAFRVDGLVAWAVPVWATAPGYCVACVLAQLPPERPGQAVLHLSRGGAVAGRVIDARGEPCAKVEVRSHLLLGMQLPNWKRTVHQIPRSLSHPGAVTDGDGRFRLVGLTPGPTLFGVLDPARGRVTTELEVVDGVDLTWEAQLIAWAQITGRVVDEAGKALARWRVVGIPPEGRRRPLTGTTDGEGRFVVDQCEAVPHRVEVQHPKGIGRAVAQFENVSPGQPPIEIRVPTDRIPSAFVSGMVGDPDGRPVAKTQCVLVRSGTMQFVFGTTEADGRFHLGPMPPGQCILQMSHEEFGSLSSEPFVVAANETRDLGVLRFQKPGTLVATITGSDGKPAVGTAAVWDPDSPVMAGFLQLKDGVARSKGLRQGRYFLSPYFAGECPIAGWPVEIKAGEETRVAVQLPKSVKRSVRFTRLSEPPPAQVTFRWRNAAGELFLVQTFPWDRAEMPQRDYWFAPGMWQLEVTTPSGRKAETTITIPDLTPCSEVILMRLP